MTRFRRWGGLVGCLASVDQIVHIVILLNIIMEFTHPLYLCITLGCLFHVVYKAHDARM